MKKIVAGIVAHVDAGKTTLSEAMLYQAGELRRLGRVDNGDAFLDSDKLEKKRGITIFSHQANLNYQDLQLTMIDTPGHMDFAASVEQILSVLDYAILVVSATDGIQGYTRTLWRLLEHYNVPAFIFVNKMDVVGANKELVLAQLQETFTSGCTEFGVEISDKSYENIAMQDDEVLEGFLNSGKITDDTVRSLISQRKIFPCYFGSALKLESVDNFLGGMERWSTERNYSSRFGATVFKISYDEKGERLTWVRVTSGSLSSKEVIVDEQKANQLRIYNGDKFTLTQKVTAGGVCALTGLTSTYPGQGLGVQDDARLPEIRPVLNYALDPKGNDIHACLVALQRLEEEDPMLHVAWSAHLQEIHVQIMGEIQLEILQQLLKERFHLDIGFDEGQILYKETITKTVEGVGHFEPLRHYSEVHLLIEPAAPNSGVVFDSQCSLEVLEKNWQHQVLTNLGSKEQLGVMIGAPLTDVHISLVSGRASNVHSVGGDFREATWRAVRQGLMELKENGCQLLEPWYRFRLEVSSDKIGRAMSDIQRMKGNFDEPITESNMTILTGTAPVSEMRSYAQEVNAYTHGEGSLDCVIDGYRPCHNANEVISKSDYDPVADLDNTPDSVFCAHGAGYPVKWDEVPQMAHVPYLFKKS